MSHQYQLIERLPPEILLRIIAFVPLETLSCLLMVSKDWYDFINVRHQDVIYNGKSEHKTSLHDFSALDKVESYAKYYNGVTSAKDLCKRERLLRKNWSKDSPTSTEALIQTGDVSVWRFRPDFESRFFLSTHSGRGGLRCTDMDTAELLWYLPNEEVQPFTHLEYSDGLAAFNQPDNVIEIWQASKRDRGKFSKIFVLNHDVEIRGFHLAFSTQLCVVSTEGRAFYYDLSDHQPRLCCTIHIEEGAVGHLFQSRENVVFSMGEQAFHVHSKLSGSLLGELQPKTSQKFYHLEQPTTVSRGDWPPLHITKPDVRPFPPRAPRNDRFVPLKVKLGHHPRLQDFVPLEDDFWGAAALSSNIMVGISMSGRVFVCTDFVGSLRSSEIAKSSFHIIETENTRRNFQIGGWLAIRDTRILFQVENKIYCMTIPDSCYYEQNIVESSVIAIDVADAYCSDDPVSWMNIYEDSIMYTFSTVRESARRVGTNFGGAGGALFGVKSIRVISLAPQDVESDG